MAARRIGVNEFARVSHYSAGYISNLRSGKKSPALRPQPSSMHCSALGASSQRRRLHRRIPGLRTITVRVFPTFAAVITWRCQRPFWRF